jgi:hypothetical protein
MQVDDIDLGSRRDVRRFVELPYRLYRGNPYWVPPLRGEATVALDPARHPFYEHSQAAFFLVRDGDRDLARLGVFEHRPYNAAHGTRQAGFTLFESESASEAASLVFERAFEWARSRGLERIVGPRGLSALDGYGLLVDAFSQRQLMTMTNYNPPYYAGMLEQLGFGKEVYFVTFALNRDRFVMPEAVHRAAERAAGQGHLRVVRYRSRRELIRAARKIGETYNRAFVNNWEYYPLSEREIDFVVDQVRPLADHRLMTFIAAGPDVVGFLLAFPDISGALQRMSGRLTPWGIASLLLERRRTCRVALNGAGIVPEYQGHGGNALLYTQIERAIRDSRFTDAELPQVAETAAKMRSDLVHLGATPLKTHRVYWRAL